MVAGVVTQAMGVRYEVRHGFELVTQVSGIKPEKLPYKLVLHLGNS
jgi:hypothetical protein